jgi:guanylate kinase
VIIILSAPSGCGKTSIANKLIESDSNLVLSVSATTRKPRETEIEGKHYFFTTREKFKQMQFLEYAEIYGNLYGTPSKYIEAKLREGKDILFDIDSKGAYQIMEKSLAGVVSIFILPPNMETLESRLRARGLDNQNAIETRMKSAKYEIANAGNYHYTVKNDNLDKAVQEIQAIILNERNKRSNENSK